jgi:hypothetical protein
MGRCEEIPISLRMAASLACRQLGGARDDDPVALDAAAEALARIVTVYQEVGGRLLELPLEDRVLGSFEGGAARFSAAGGTYRRLYVRRAELEEALAALAGGLALTALAEEEHSGEDRTAGD